MKIWLPILILISILTACGDSTEDFPSEGELTEMVLPEKDSVDIPIDEYLGKFKLAEQLETGEIVLVENCWSKSVEEFAIEEFVGSPGWYYFVFDGFHATMYEMNSARKEGETLIFTGTLEDESSEEEVEFQLTQNEDESWSLESKNGNYLLIPEAKKEAYQLIPCDERRELSDLGYMNEIFQGYFALAQGGEKLSHYFPKEGIELILPDTGVAPIEQTVHKSEEIVVTGIFLSPVYDRLMEYVQMHNNEERSFLEFVDEVPDRCMPEKEALFVKSTAIEAIDQPLEAITFLTKMNDELEEVYTYVVVHFLFTDRMYITKIDASECSL